MKLSVPFKLTFVICVTKKNCLWCDVAIISVRQNSQNEIRNKINRIVWAPKSQIPVYFIPDIEFKTMWEYRLKTLNV